MYQSATHTYPVTTKDASLSTYTTAPLTSASMARALRMLGSSRPMRTHSARPTSSGVEARNTMNVSTFAYCSVLIFAKIHARKAAATGKNARIFSYSSSSTSMQPNAPTILTASHEHVTCASRTNDGAGSKCTASLLITSLNGEART